MAEATVSMSVVVMAQTAEALEAMEGVQAMEEAEGSIAELMPVLEERVEGDHAEGVLQQWEQLEHELREDSDVQEVLGLSTGASATARASMTELEMVLRQG